MNRFCTYFCLCVAMGLASSTAHAQYNQRQGTVVGGLTGAAAGAVIGENSGEPGVGAAIGGVVGAVAGSLLGKNQDQYYYQSQLARQQAYAAQQQRQAYAQSRSLSVADVVSLHQSGVGQGIISREIQQRGLQRQLEIADIVHLSRQGVTDSVIRTMQQASIGGPAVPQFSPRSIPPRPIVVTRTIPVPTPIVVQGYHRPRGYGPPPHHYYNARGRGPSVRASIHLR